MSGLMQTHFASPSVEVDTEILERCAIGIQWASIRPKNTDLLWREIQDLSKLCFALPDLLFRSFCRGDVHHRPDKLDAARFIAQGMRHHVEIFDGTIRHQ